MRTFKNLKVVKFTEVNKLKIPIIFLVLVIFSLSICSSITWTTPSTPATNLTNYYNKSQVYNQSEIDSMNATWSSTYNSTYDATSKNVNANQSSWSSTYNSTYDSTSKDVTANRSNWESKYNATYSGAVNNGSYLSTYNQTYEGSLNNGSYLSTSNATYQNYINANQSNNSANLNGHQEANLNVNSSKTSNSTSWWGGVSGWVNGFFQKTGNNLDVNTTYINTNTNVNYSQDSLKWQGHTGTDLSWGTGIVYTETDPAFNAWYNSGNPTVTTITANGIHTNSWMDNLGLDTLISYSSGTGLINFNNNNLTTNGKIQGNNICYSNGTGCLTGSSYNATYNGLINNASYLSTYNATYNGLVSNLSLINNDLNKCWVNQSNVFNGNQTIVGNFNVRGDSSTNYLVNVVANNSGYPDYLFNAVGHTGTSNFQVYDDGCPHIAFPKGNCGGTYVDQTTIFSANLWVSGQFYPASSITLDASNYATAGNPLTTSQSYAMNTWAWDGSNGYTNGSASTISATQLNYTKGVARIDISAGETNGYFGYTNHNPLSVYSNGFVYVSQNVSATGYITRTDVFDKSKGTALSQIKDASSYINTDSSINHTAFGISAVTYETTDYSRPVYTNITKCLKLDITKSPPICLQINITNEVQVSYPFTKTEEGVSLDKEVALIKQADYELKIKLDEKDAQIKFLNDSINEIKAKLDKAGIK